MGQHRMLNQKLALITTLLLEEEDHIPTISQATSELFQLLIGITSLDSHEAAHRKPMFLPKGKSIGPYWAAMCVNDLLRTKKFVRGLFYAIKSAQKVFPDDPIHILYAGTGPFATLALPMTTVFTPEEIQFTFLEANPVTLDLTHQTIDAFGIRAFVKSVELVDASLYIPTEDVHILLAEMMQRALDKEPQVAITQHLAPYIHPDGFLVPESIRIQAGLLNPSREIARLQDFTHPAESYIQFLKVVFELNRHTTYSFSEKFPEIEIEVSATQALKYPQLNLFTEVHVFEAQKLTPWQSGLTVPKKIADLHPHDQAYQRMTFQYLAGKEPGFHFRILE